MAQERQRAERLRGSHLYLTFGFITLLAAPALAYRADHVPDWVRTAAEQKTPEYAPETNTVVLLKDTTYTVASDGSAVEHDRRVVKILRPEGRGQGVVGVPFDKDSKILSMHVLHYTRTYTVREVTLPADRYGDVQKLAGVIAADEQSSAVLKKQ